MNSVFTSIGTYCHAWAVWRQLSLPLQAPTIFWEGLVERRMAAKGEQACGASWPVMLHLHHETG